MAVLDALYRQDPFWVWLALGCLFVSLNLATGTNRLMAPAVAAVLMALAELVGLKLGLTIEAALFLGLCVLALVGGWMVKPRAKVDARAPQNPGKGAGAPGRQDQTGRLVGRIGRTTSEFANGVGRVWIDGAEWGAELDGGEEGLPEGAPVRVVRVIGGIRLQVHALTTG
jgi:membrane protein implicated in regulation of membrane protease activity